MTICAPEEAEPNHVQVNDRSGGPIPADIVASLPTRFLLDIARSDGNQNLTVEIKVPFFFIFFFFFFFFFFAALYMTLFVRSFRMQLK